MRKRIAKSLIATALVVSITGSTVWADEVSDLTNLKNQAQAELNASESQLANLLIEMNDLELKMHDKNDEIETVNKNLADTQAKLDQQYADMKLRIKYMYEDQTTSITDAFLTAQSMSDALNKAEYVQNVYNYDRSKLEEIAQTTLEIQNLKVSLENEKKQMEELGNQMTAKQASLYATIADQKDKVADADAQLTKAVEAAAAAAAAEEQRRAAAAAAASSSNSVSYNGGSSLSSSSSTASASSAAVSSIVASNSNVASGVVSLAYAMLGVPYVWGGTTPAGFDCSGFTQFVYAQFGISMAHSSYAQENMGTLVSIDNAQPGDLVTWNGHAAIYIGGGNVVNAMSYGTGVAVCSIYAIGNGNMQIHRL